MGKKQYNSLVLKKRAVDTVVAVIRTLFLIGMCYLFLFPVIYMAITALQDPNAVNDPTSVWIPKSFSLTAIKKAIEELDYWKSLILTLEISVFSTLAALVSCSFVGYGFARFKFAGKSIATILLFLTIIIPPQTLLSANYVNFRYFDFGGLLSLLSPITGKENYYLLDNPLTFILPSVFAAGLKGGLFIFIFKQFFQGLPNELEEAAKIDGCGTLSTYFRIMMPLAGSAFITVLLFSFIWHWNDFYSASTYFTQGALPLSVQLNNFRSAVNNGMFRSSTDFEVRMYLQAAALIVSLPPLVLYMFTQKHFTESVVRTGIVG